MREFNFIVRTPPDEYTINEFHRSLAESLIIKFGGPTMKEVVRQIQVKNNEQT
jgi:hypothetical protein